MGLTFGKHVKSHRLSQVEERIVNGIKERGASGKSSLKSFNSIIMQFSKFDKTFEAIRGIFRTADKNGNGTIELGELKECFRELQVSYTDEEIEELYAVSDIDSNRGIDFKEFIVLLALAYLLEMPADKESKCQLGMPQLELAFDRIVDAFLFFDKNGDGYVSKSEIVETINDASPGSRHAGSIGLQRFEEMDSDKNGLISFKEFLFAFTNWVGVKDEGSDENNFVESVC